MSNRKKIITEWLSKTKDGDHAEIYFSDLPKDLKDDDIINIDRVDNSYSENNSYDSFTKITVHRMRDETDEEVEKRLENKKCFTDRMKKMRYENYLKLKKEFENE